MWPIPTTKGGPTVFSGLRNTHMKWTIFLDSKLVLHTRCSNQLFLVGKQYHISVNLSYFESERKTLCQPISFFFIPSSIDDPNPFVFNLSVDPSK
jgi:hypothetical protein